MGFLMGECGIEERGGMVVVNMEVTMVFVFMIMKTVFFFVF